ncbi:MAG: lytic transglycosylase protein, partial [Burkholderia sp.]|nr:lytic transglycosylase protein [Burkholderia sp.]
MLPSLIGPTPEEPPQPKPGARLRALFAATGRVNVLRIAAHRTVMGAGVCAIGAIGVMFVRPELTDHIKAMSPFAAKTTQQAAAAVPVPAPSAIVVSAAKPTAAAVVVSPAETVNVQSAASPAEQAAKSPAADLKDTSPREQKWVTNWLSKRYRVAGDATNMLVSATYNTAREVKIDPLLVLAVMAIESGFNPFAESPVGAQGLMQVMSKLHHDKFQPLGGVKAALNPVANIKVGATILKEYVSRGGSIESGLKMYVGAAAFENDAGYGYKVLAEYKRLKEVASGKNVPVTTTTLPPATVAVKT